SRRSAPPSSRRSAAPWAAAVVAAAALAAATDADARAVGARPPRVVDSSPVTESLALLGDQASTCTRCRLAQSRTQVVFGLGNFATKLLSGKPAGITRVHGTEQETTIGGNRVLLYPLYHPAAALYTPAMLKVLEDDFRRLPDLLGRVTEPVPEVEPELELVA